MNVMVRGAIPERKERCRGNRETNKGSQNARGEQLRKSHKGERGG